MPEVLSKFPFELHTEFGHILFVHTNHLKIKKDLQGWLSSITNFCPDPGNVATFLGST